jgi:pyruvate,orthophosphate dikinase
MASLGERLGRHFGDAADPLLVSVRSGAPVSMPGMMDTILDLGLSAATLPGLARAVGDERFAADCLRRLRDGYRAVTGAEVPDDPWQQLRAAVEAVFASWNSDRARTYRRREAISEDLGTAVTVQAMVFGNRGADSGTGVLFTRNPSTGEPVLYGDFLFNAQGEDVVAGSHATQPLSALDERLPAAASELRRVANLLEHHYADLCDIEFTVEQGRLWLLQVRVGKRSPRAALRMAIDMALQDGFPLSRAEAVRRVAPLLADPPRIFVRADDAPAPIATGLPASPGVASGAMVTSADAAEAAAAEGRSVILVRPETSPDDVRGMARATGVLTARGGLASHAAVVARGWGIPAVVGAEAVRLGDDRIEIGDHTLPMGAEITIDGGSGEIFVGQLGGATEVAPEAATLLEWADALGVELERAETRVPGGAGAAPRGEPAARLAAEDLIHALAIRGTVTTEQAAEGLMDEPSRVTPLVEALAGDGLVEATGDGLRLSASGKLRASALLDADRSSFGEERAASLLAGFHAFDSRVKQVVTAWQLRDVGGEQTFNDHGDAAYDAGVL